MDLSQIDGNPTNEIHKHYADLNKITDEKEYYDAVMAVVKPMVGKGMSERNFKTFVKNLNGASRRGLISMQSYVTNFMLAGIGLRAEENEIKAIGNLIKEDIRPIEFTPRQMKFKKLVESNSNFFVTLAENTLGPQQVANQGTARTNPIDSYVLYSGDGPTTPFVIISRLFELVAQGKLTPDQAANYAHKYGALSQ